MKPTERVLEVDSTLTGERVGMGIDTSALNHIMSVLTDLYSDPELAVIREYSTNALDAHRDAGNPAPIEVTLPTSLAPFFRVRDFGDGLDAEDIRDIYSRYGTSTKRDSDDVVGMLGLGAKSGLTYTDQFTLVATKNGRTVQVSVARDEDGGGSMTIVSDEPSDAPSGVEVIIPAKRDNAFERKAREFFRFWSPGTVLVNGEPPEHIAAATEGTWLVKDRLLAVDRKRLQTPGSHYMDTSSAGWVVMGNVPYPMPQEAVTAQRGYAVIAFVDIGDVNFTPSREALQMTRRTKDTLERIAHDVTRELTRAVQERVTNAATPADALREAATADAWGVSVTDLKYRGRTIPDAFKRASIDGLGSYLVTGSSYYAKKAGDHYRALPIYADGRAWFTGFKAQDFSKPKRDKFAAWLTAEGIERPKQLVFVDKLTADEKFWLEGTPVYDWTPVQAIKVHRDSNGVARSRPALSYYSRVGGRWTDRPADELTGTIVKFLGPLREAYYDSTLREIPDSVTIVQLPANRLAKFERDFPASVTVAEYLKAEATAWAAKQTPADLEAAWYQMLHEGSRLNGLDHTRIPDPELARAARLQNTRVAGTLNALQTHRRYLAPPTGLPTGNPLAKYPLLASGYGLPNKEHALIYIAAAYAAANPPEEA